MKKSPAKTAQVEDENQTEAQVLLAEVSRLLKNTDAITLLIRRDTLVGVQDQLFRMTSLEK